MVVTPFTQKLHIYMMSILMSPMSSSPVLGESWPFTKSEDLCLCVEMFGKKCHSNIFQIHKSTSYILVTIVGGFTPTKNQHISQTRILSSKWRIVFFNKQHINNKLKPPPNHAKRQPYKHLCRWYDDLKGTTDGRWLDWFHDIISSGAYHIANEHDLQLGRHHLFLRMSCLRRVCFCFSDRK